MNPTGFSLLDLLRRRRELRLAEVVRLCGELPRELDERVRRRQSDAVFLDRIQVVLRGESAEPQGLLDTPVTEWPEFSVQIAEPEEEELDRTIASTRMDQRTAAGAAPFARLLYELLGGKQRGGVTKQRPPPLPALNEEGNNILRQALTEEAERESYASFWQRWLRACEVVMEPGGWHIPKWLLPVAQPGTALYLVPSEQAGLPIALIARPVFRLGRSRSTSDFPTRVLLRGGEVDEEKTVQVSRIQVLGEWREGRLTLRDGNGEKPSANGTLWNGEPLSAAVPAVFFAAGELVLGGVYHLNVTPVPRPLGPPEIENLAEWSAPSLTIVAPPDFGAVVFRPPAGQALTRDAVWLGRGIGFHPVRDRGPAWDLAATRSPAQFLYVHGCFWIANTSVDQNQLAVNEAILKPGQVAPLADGQAVELGGRKYTVTVEV
ncbi:MAG TPA: hypothetical protein VGO11_08165 [Chthoniobacteraceae bacterium]|nr:hypothetical protein [Chthoniobacteraceae bacterium]